MFRKSTFFLVLVMVLAFTVLAVGCEETTTPERVEKNDVEQLVKTDDSNDLLEETIAPTTETFSMGDTVKMGDLEFTLKGARWDQGDQFMKPDPVKVPGKSAGKRKGMGDSDFSRNIISKYVRE